MGAIIVGSVYSILGVTGFRGVKWGNDLTTHIRGSFSM